MQNAKLVAEGKNFCCNCVKNSYMHKYLFLRLKSRLEMNYSKHMPVFKVVGKEGRERTREKRERKGKEEQMEEQEARVCCPRPLPRNVCPKARLRRRALEDVRAPERARRRRAPEGARRRRPPKAPARKRPPKARARRRSPKAPARGRAPEGGRLNAPAEARARRRPPKAPAEGARPKTPAEGARRRRPPKARARRRPPEGARPKALLSAVFRCLCFCGVFVFLLGSCQNVSAVFCVDAELRCPVLWPCVVDVVPCRCVVRGVCFAVCVCVLLCFLYCCCVVCMSAVLVCF